MSRVKGLGRASGAQCRVCLKPARCQSGGLRAKEAGCTRLVLDVLVFDVLVLDVLNVKTL